MKVLVMQHGSGDRYRTVQYFRCLESMGFSFNDPHYSLDGQWNLWLEAAREADVVWIARRLLSVGRLASLQRANPAIVFDFDDALWLRSSRHGGSRAFSKSFKFARTVETARHVIAGNDFLSREACRHVSADKISTLPTVVNRDWYGARPAQKRQDFVIGWMGSKATVGYLDMLRPAFEAFHALGRPWRLKVVSDVFPDWDHLPVEHKPWRLADEEIDLHDMDVGLNPLTDDDWSRGKCALKTIQTLAAGVPVLGSPIGVNVDLINEGRNGRLCRTMGDWFAAFEELSDKPQSVFEWGQSGRDSIWNTFTMEAQAPNLARALETAA